MTGLYASDTTGQTAVGMYGCGVSKWATSSVGKVVDDPWATSTVGKVVDDPRATSTVGKVVDDPDGDLADVENPEEEGGEADESVQTKLDEYGEEFTKGEGPKGEEHDREFMEPELEETEKGESGTLDRPLGIGCDWMVGKADEICCLCKPEYVLPVEILPPHTEVGQEPAHGLIHWKNFCLDHALTVLLVVSGNTGNFQRLIQDHAIDLTLFERTVLAMCRELEGSRISPTADALLTQGAVALLLMHVCTVKLNEAHAVELDEVVTAQGNAFQEALRDRAVARGSGGR